MWCLDGDNPDHASAWARAARNADRRWPYFGRAWNWGSSICASWPGKDRDRYAGPFNRRTANDVLVIGNRYDPATRYQDAVSTARMLLAGCSRWRAGDTPRCSSRPASTRTSTGTCSPAARRPGRDLPAGHRPVRRAGLPRPPPRSRPTPTCCRPP